jgi:hypothetical protein
MNFFAYYGFVSNYTQGLFSVADFRLQYDSDIYRYRILGKYLLLATNQILEQIPLLPDIAPARMMQFLGIGSMTFYYSYYVLNTVFLCLTIFAFRSVFNSAAARMTDQENALWLFVITTLIVISQFVVVPYDNLSYFFIGVSVYLMLQKESRRVIAALVATLVLATLTRETAALILALYATLYLSRQRLPMDKRLSVLALLILAFLIMYILLRVFFGWENALGHDVTLSFFDWRKPAGLISLTLGFSILVLLGNLVGSARMKTVWIFLGFSLPYIASIFITSTPYEFRVWVPVLLGAIVVGNLRLNPQVENKADSVQTGN